MASEKEVVEEHLNGVAQEAAAGRKARSDKGLPRRRSLMLSRAASARFVRVAAALPGGEEELAGMLEPWIDKLFDGGLIFDEAGEANTLEDVALAAVAKRMKGEASDA